MSTTWLNDGWYLYLLFIFPYYSLISRPWVINTILYKILPMISIIIFFLFLTSKPIFEPIWIQLISCIFCSIFNNQWLLEFGLHLLIIILLHLIHKPRNINILSPLFLVLFAFYLIDFDEFVHSWNLIIIYYIDIYSI